MQQQKIRGQYHKEYTFLEVPKQNYGILAGGLLEGIVETGIDAFGSSMSAQEIREHIYPTDRVYLAYKEKRVVGFATALIKETYIDLVGAAIRPEAQGSSIYGDFVLRRINFALDEKKNAIQFRTQNPKVYLGVRRCLHSLREMGVITEFILEEQIRAGLYGRMLTVVQPFCHVPKIDALFSRLNYEKGDAFVVDVQMRVRT